MESTRIKTVQDILNSIKENNIKMLDFKMVDVSGQYCHVTIPANAKSSELRRFELRNPDATCNPYFCYAAIPCPAEFEKYYNF